MLKQIFTLYISGSLEIEELEKSYIVSKELCNFLKKSYTDPEYLKVFFF